MNHIPLSWYSAPLTNHNLFLTIPLEKHHSNTKRLKKLQKQANHRPFKPLRGR